MTTPDAPELIDTVATHVQWLRRDGLADDHRADNEQSADYLARLSELLVLVTGRLGEAAAASETTDDGAGAADLVIERFVEPGPLQGAARAFVAALLADSTTPDPEER
jgi:hypothetical protein